MIDILFTTLPIYLLIVIGFAAVRSGYVAGDHIAVLSRFALRVCLPALIFTAIAMPLGDQGLNAAFMLAYAAGSVAALLIGFAVVRLVLRQPASPSWILAMGMSNSNSGFIGFPVASLFFGPDAAVVFAMTMIIENALTLPLPTVAASASAGGAKLVALIKNAALALMRNPLVIAVVFALAIRSTGLPIAAPIEQTARMLAGVASPLALFVIGGTVAQMAVSGHWRRVSAVTLGKLVLHPLLVTAMLLTMPGVPPSLIPVGIVFAAMPMVAIYPLLAGPFGLGAVSSTSVVVATLLSCVTISLTIGWVQGL